MSQQLGFLNTISASYVVPDKDLQRNTKPKIHLAKFGDGLFKVAKNTAQRH